MKYNFLDNMKKFFRVAVIVIIAALVLATFIYLFVKSRPDEVTYDVVTPSVQTISRKTIATGKIEPRNEVEIKPQISGIISEIYFEAGAMVKKDDVIALVKVIPEMSQLNAAESNLNLAKIELDQAKVDYERAQRLYDKKVLSTEEFEKETVTYKKAKENYDNANSNLQIIRDGIIKKEGQYSNTQIRATISGMILDVPVKVGNSVILSNTFNDGTTICTIADMSDMIFKGSIDESEVGNIHPGMPIELSVGALQNSKFNALLEYVSPKGTETNGTVMFEIKAAVDVPDTILLRAGYSANAEIILKQRTNVLSVPEYTVELNGDSAFVFTLDSAKNNEQKFNKVPVEVGLSDGINIEIVSGIDEDAKLRGNRKEKK